MSGETNKASFITAWVAQSRSVIAAGLLAALLGGASVLGFVPGDTPDARSTTVQNVQAFAKLYGYVRYFHPSDAASAIDWEDFAVHGVRRVKGAADREELRERLEHLFSPIAPTMQLYPTTSEPPAPPDVLTPSDTTGLNLVAWQHRGVGLGNRGPYRSVRLHRESASSGGSRFGTVAQSVEAIPHRGKEVRLRAAVRAEVSDTEGQAQLWLRVDRTGGGQGFFDNMSDRPITDSNWKTYEITGPVAEDAERVVFGGFLSGSGAARFDAFQLQVRDSTGAEWTTVSLENTGFESGDAKESPEEWRGGGNGYAIETKQENSYEGAQSLAIRSQQSTGMAESLFEKWPDAGQVANKPIGQGLSAQIPLALYSRDEQTLRPDEAPSLSELETALEVVETGSLTAKDEALRLADVTIAWNVFQHFYPYFDVVDVDWEEVLPRTLRRAQSDQSSEEFLRTLRHMVAQLDDGHGRVSHPVDESMTGLPLRVDRIEDEVIVTDTASYVQADLCPEPGDAVVSIDGTSVEDALESAKQYISGSSQWKSFRALRGFGEGKAGTSAQLTLRRQGKEVECQVSRADTSEERTRRQQLETEARPDSIQRLGDGIYYVDVTRAGREVLRPRMEELAEADGVVFDVRGYPEGGTEELLQHVSRDTLRSARWKVPQIVFPDHKNVAGYDTSGRWTLPPKTPQITGEIAFLTDERALSYGESIMGIVEHYKLGEIVGQPTAGVNGNVNPFSLPGDYRVVWTGMRVVKHDGSQHHLVGIQPTIPVERTVEGVREGRDEILEAALDAIQGAERAGE